MGDNRSTQRIALVFGHQTAGCLSRSTRATHGDRRGVEVTLLPDPYPEYGQDAHCLRLHPLRPDRLYPHGHCGIYRLELDRPSEEWIRIGKTCQLRSTISGFRSSIHPRDPHTAWVFSMDGTTVWPRTSPGGRPATYVSHARRRASWERQGAGLPRGRKRGSRSTGRLLAS